MTGRDILPYHGSAIYTEGIIPQEDRERLFFALAENVEWIQEPIQIFGKKVMQPRLTAWFGDRSYSYSGITMRPSPWTPELKRLKALAENAAGSAFNSALLNFYRDGQDSVGWHRDNEKELGREPVIASLSLGASRTFFMRPYKAKEPKIAIELKAGDMLVMKGESQIFWEHSLPKTAKVQEPRINITFREIS